MTNLLRVIPAGKGCDAKSCTHLFACFEPPSFSATFSNKTVSTLILVISGVAHFMILNCFFVVCIIKLLKVSVVQVSDGKSHHKRLGLHCGLEQVKKLLHCLLALNKNYQQASELADLVVKQHLYPHTPNP